MSPTSASPLDMPLARLWGVGPERGAQLARLGLHTIGDLLLHRPRRHEDRRHFLAIRDLRLGQAATTRGRIVAQGLKTYRKETRSVFEFILDDGTARLHCRWWNLPFMEKYFKVGDDVMVFGKPKALKPRTMDHPETEVVVPGEEMSIHLDRVVPVYPLTEGLPQRWLRSLMWRTLGEWEKQLVEPWPELMLSPFPSRAQAIHCLHFPGELDQAELARQRLALDELIELQIRIQTRRRKLQANARGLPCAGDNHLIKPFLGRLGFTLTESQTAVLREIRKDMGGLYPMRRLLQGDVGSGKTVVAACTALMALESGCNAALMAPTEILAEQHFKNFTRWFDPLGLRVELQTGSTKTLNTKDSLLFSPATLGIPAPSKQTEPLPNPLTRPEGSLSPSKGERAGERGASNQRGGSESQVLVIGTHALIEPAFALPNLGLVIIDEQHKFGVAQRETFLRKGRYPHLLVMTATPIPRTLGLTLYGDLDLSVIREAPPGRGRIRTFVRGPAQLPKVYEFIRARLAEGRQAYVVYPRIEENDLKSGLKAVKQEHERLEKEFAPHCVALLHGRLRPEEKERVMVGFHANEIKVLLSTSVIEVGVDVPNATVMLIENTEQFGLAQLHQLRGRIGRGAHESWCVLVANHETVESRQRLRVLAESTDGFQIAEADLALRGPGEFLGQDQSGLPPFRFADLARDRALVEQARPLAAKVLAQLWLPSCSKQLTSRNPVP